jgi:phage terminase large subunit-like protein
VLAADSDTLDGWGGTLALVDELGRHKSVENFGLLRDGLGPREGQLVALSTAGDDEESALGQLRAAAHAMPGFGRSPDNSKHKIVRRDGFAFHEWSLDSPEEADDLVLVKMANPASWVDLAELRARRDSPSMARWQWGRFSCGLWVAGAESAISPDAWSACAQPGLEIPAGTAGVLIGGDLGWKHDFSAFVPIVAVDSDVHVHPPTILKPPGDGTSIDAELIFDVVRQMAATWPQATFVLDPEAGGEQLAQRIERELSGSARVATHSQKTSPMCAAAQRLSEAISAKRLKHPDDEELNRHVLAAGAQVVGSAWKFSKPRGKARKIDALVALSMANSVLVAKGAAPRKLSGAWFGGSYAGSESAEEVAAILAERKAAKTKAPLGQRKQAM